MKVRCLYLWVNRSEMMSADAVGRPLDSASPLASFPCDDELADHRIGFHSQSVAKSKQSNKRGLPPTAFEQRHERLIELALERQLPLRKSPLFPELSEQVSERGSEPIGLVHAAQHGDCTKRCQRL